MRRSIFLPILRRYTTWPAMLLLAALSLTLTTSAQSPAPGWWVEREVIVPTASADNSAIANIGQLKHLAAMAVEEMNAKLPMRDGAGEELEEWVASWTETGTDDYAAVNVGQLKALAQRFYDRLASIGLEGDVPWDGVADDFALANIGQVKQVFAIEFFDPLDTDADALADAWEMEHFGHLNYTGADDPDEDGFANLDEFLGGTYPVYGAGQGSVYGGFGGSGGTGGGSGPFQGGSNPTDSESIPIFPLEFSGSVLELEGAPRGAAGPCARSRLLNGGFERPQLVLTEAEPWPELDINNQPKQTHEFIEPMHWQAMGERSMAERVWKAAFAWRPVVGDHIEMQRFQDAAPWGGGQFAELDGDRINDEEGGPFGHGVKQEITLRKGTYLLSFDYRGRRESWAQSVAFKVSAQSAHSPATRAEVAPLIPAPGTQLEWKRATVLIEVKGGPPVDLRQKVEIAFELHETDTPNGVGPRIDNVCLLPIDIKLEAKPEFDNVDDNPDPWTNKTNGKRIMVGAPENDHGGDMRRELNVKVSIPGYANQPVYLKVFDVDDPSTVSDPGDKLDPNDDAGDDNMHAVGLGDNWGHFIPQAAKQITVTLNSSGETTATFKVNQQPGNNYRVAVAIKDADLNVLQVTNPGGQGFVTSDDKSVSGFNGAITPMHTVWRKLHIEVDSMEAVSTPKDSPDRVDAVGDHWANDASGLQNRQRLYLAGSLPEGNNFYERGRLKAGGAEYKIVESGSNWVTLSTSVQSVPPGFIGPVEIYDDDDRGLAGPPLPKPSLITQGVKDIFKRAYIAIEERTQNPTKTIPFKLYTSVVHPLLADSSLNNAIDTNGDDWGGFWNHYLIASYQPHQSASDDPTGDSVEGATTPTGYGPRYSVIFVETIRDFKAGFLDLNIADFNTRLDEIVAHEIGHGPNDPGGFFAGSHPESGLMGDSAPQHHFSAESLKRFRQVYRWQEP